MSVDTFGKCTDVIASVIFDLHVQRKIDLNEFSLFGSFEPICWEDDYFDVLDDCLASLSPSDYHDYIKQLKEESKMSSIFSSMCYINIT